VAFAASLRAVWRPPVVMKKKVEKMEYGIFDQM
jgi:hypothetical protein